MGLMVHLKRLFLGLTPLIAVFGPIFVVAYFFGPGAAAFVLPGLMMLGACYGLGRVIERAISDN